MKIKELIKYDYECIDCKLKSSGNSGRWKGYKMVVGRFKKEHTGHLIRISVVYREKIVEKKS